MSELEVNMASQDAKLASQHGRTDGRTYEESTCDTAHLSSGTRAGGATRFDIPTLADVLGAGFMRTTERHPIVRTGEREPISWHKRSAIWYRDGGKCQLCQTVRPKPWHLDHIVPWSAGGPDDSENLRVLCEPCNMARSNHVDGEPVQRRPVTWWCHRCYLPEHGWSYATEDAWQASIALSRGGAWCHRTRDLGHQHCRVEGIYKMQAEQGDAPTWHQRAPLEHLTMSAYCAHCNAPGLTDVTL